jgi:hypothetical protein
LSIIIPDISHKYHLKNATNSSGDNFSDKVVNQAKSEKKVVIFFLSPAKFTAQVQ